MEKIQLKKEITETILKQYKEDMKKSINGKVTPHDVWIIENVVANTMKLLNKRRERTNDK